MLHQGKPEQADEWFRLNASFHEGLASNSRFPTDAVRRQNNLRRMHEPVGSTTAAERIEQSCRAHLAILDAVEAGEIEWVEALLRRHLRPAAVRRRAFRCRRIDRHQVPLPHVGYQGPRSGCLTET